MIAGVEKEELQTSKKEALPLTRRGEGHGRKWEQARERQQTCKSLVGGLCGESGGRWVRNQATVGRMRDMCFTI